MYPVNILLDHKPVLVLGGGTVALQKVKSLLAAQAAVTLIAPTLCPELMHLSALKQLEWLPKEYTPGDEKGYFLLICATDDQDVNERAAHRAQKRRMLVNVVDKPQLSNWTSPSVIRQGDLVVTISTNGKSPALSRYLRQQWEKQLTPEYAKWLDALAEVRTCAQYALTSPELRQAYWRTALSQKLMDLALSGHIDTAQKILLEKLDLFIKDKGERHESE